MKKFKVEGRETIFYQTEIIEAETKEEAEAKYQDLISPTTVTESQDYIVETEEVI